MSTEMVFADLLSSTLASRCKNIPSRPTTLSRVAFSFYNLVDLNCIAFNWMDVSSYLTPAASFIREAS